MKDYTYALDIFLDKFPKNFIFISFPFGYGGNTLNRVISASPEIYWNGDSTAYPDDTGGFPVIYDSSDSPHFATFTEQHLCCTHTETDFMYPDGTRNRVIDLLNVYKTARFTDKKLCINSHNSFDLAEKHTKITMIRLCGKAPTFRSFTKPIPTNSDPIIFSNVINVDVNDIFSSEYSIFETTYLGLCSKLNITPQINRVRAFILLWLEKQERYKKLKIS